MFCRYRRFPDSCLRGASSPARPWSRRQPPLAVRRCGLGHGQRPSRPWFVPESTDTRAGTNSPARIRPRAAHLLARISSGKSGASSHRSRRMGRWNGRCRVFSVDFCHRWTLLIWDSLRVCSLNVGGKMDAWRCEHCGFCNYTGSRCIKCGAKRPPVRPGASSGACPSTVVATREGTGVP